MLMMNLIGYFPELSRYFHESDEVTLPSELGA